MITQIDPSDTTTLEDYGAHAHITSAVQDLRNEAGEFRRQMGGRSVLMVNSTSQGGGVAEMLPKFVSILNQLGIPARWIVMGSEDPAFFRLTKRIHNMIHGVGNGSNEFTGEDRRLFEHEGELNAEALRSILAPDDLLVIHDPQPLALGAILKKCLKIPAIWRCHIGLDELLPSSRSAWEFLKPYITVFDHNVFSADEYIPEYIRDRSSVIYPAIDPLSSKNCRLRAEQTVSILHNAGLAVNPYSLPAAPLHEKAKRLQPDGSFGPAYSPDEIGFLHRPVVSQISRWDRLKGFQPLLDGFVLLKKDGSRKGVSLNGNQRRRLELLRLVMVGPDPDSIQDDPEGCEVLSDLCDRYIHLEPEIQKDVVLLALPMHNRDRNALMVNAIQTASSIVVQNSIREGFGLTLTEAMWKGTPVVGSSACGLRQQIRDYVHGRVVAHPDDPLDVAQVLEQILYADDELDLWTRNARMRVHQEFLIFSQVKKWLRVMKRQQSMCAPICVHMRSDDSRTYSSVGHLKLHYPEH
ncbi:MAG: glycosyltransferase [Acidobacteriota bacterium]